MSGVVPAAESPSPPGSAARPGPRRIEVGGVRMGADLPMALLAGPCAIEGRAHALETAEALRGVCADAGVGLIYKSSFDKANRTSADSPRGVGMAEGLAALAEVRGSLGVPTITDVHLPEQCAPAAEAVDALQIPAFLCRQTDLLTAAAATGAAVNVKKGQFLAPWDMRAVAAKLEGAGATRVMLTERGSCFGYNALVVDMAGLPVLAATGWPVVFDCTHAVQRPGGLGSRSGGRRASAPALARAAVAVGTAAVFLETHRDPDRAPSDGPNMIPLADLPGLLSVLTELDAAAKRRPLDPAAGEAGP